MHLMQLLSNAIKFTAVGSVTLTVTVLREPWGNGEAPRPVGDAGAPGEHGAGAAAASDNIGQHVAFGHVQADGADGGDGGGALGGGALGGNFSGSSLHGSSGSSSRMVLGQNSQRSSGGARDSSPVGMPSRSLAALVGPSAVAAASMPTAAMSQLAPIPSALSDAAERGDGGVVGGSRTPSSARSLPSGVVVVDVIGGASIGRGASRKVSGASLKSSHTDGSQSHPKRSSTSPSAHSSAASSARGVGTGPSSSSVCVIRVQVVDTGVGISGEAMQQLFQPYFQAKKSVTRTHGLLPHHQSSELRCCALGRCCCC